MSTVASGGRAAPLVVAVDGGGSKTDVAVLDLATGAHRLIGRAPGGWTMDTAIPHPYVDVRWAEGSHEGGPSFPGREVTLVSPETERPLTLVR